MVFFSFFLLQVKISFSLSWLYIHTPGSPDSCVAWLPLTMPCWWWWCSPRSVSSHNNVGSFFLFRPPRTDANSQAHSTSIVSEGFSLKRSGIISKVCSDYAVTFTFGLHGVFRFAPRSFTHIHIHIHSHTFIYTYKFYTHIQLCYFEFASQTRNTSLLEYADHQLIVWLINCAFC